MTVQIYYTVSSSTYMAVRFANMSTCTYQIPHMYSISENEYERLCMYYQSRSQTSSKQCTGFFVHLNIIQKHIHKVTINININTFIKYTNHKKGQITTLGRPELCYSHNQISRAQH